MTDELKPVPCGCGGEAKVHHVDMIPYHLQDRWYVSCPSCNICTDMYYTEAEAVQAWNRAMGDRDDIAITKGTWMMTLDGFHCSVCFYKCEATALPDVCPHCGTKMEG